MIGMGKGSKAAARFSNAGETGFAHGAAFHTYVESSGPFGLSLT